MHLISLIYMLNAAFDNTSHVVVGEGIVYSLSLSAVSNEAGAFEDAELMGHRRLGNSQKLS